MCRSRYSATAAGSLPYVFRLQSARKGQAAQEIHEMSFFVREINRFQVRL
jgi:hypothetical protein